MAFFRRFVFDCDSTLVRIEGIDWLAERAGVGEEVARLTRAAMEGEMPLDAVYARRLQLVRPDAGALAALADAYVSSLVEDAGAVVSALLALGKRVTLLSAGLRPALLPLADRLGLDPGNVFAVDVFMGPRGEYVGCDRMSPLTRPGGKGVVLRAKGLAGPETLAVGDGASDLEMKGSVGLLVGFGGVAVRERVRLEADLFVEGPGLAPILAVGLTERERRMAAERGYGEVVRRADAWRRDG
ncbi:MAG: HAD-IB family phosphatase [Candidatus Tectomicrobia bacterium]|nr:HAD-IB family phosphatase [Candidatus Tectomicrobia bacterium]